MARDDERRPGTTIAFEVCAVAVAAQLLLVTLRLAGVLTWPWWLLAIPWWGLAGLVLATGALMAVIALAGSLFDWGWSRLETVSDRRRARQRRAVTEIMKERNSHG